VKASCYHEIDPRWAVLGGVAWQQWSKFGELEVRRIESKTFDWGSSFEYLYGGSLRTNIAGSVPVAVGGRGDVAGSFNNVGFRFVAAHCAWNS